MKKLSVYLLVLVVLFLMFECSSASEETHSEGQDLSQETETNAEDVMDLPKGESVQEADDNEEETTGGT
jgi:hypothetical protein